MKQKSSLLNIENGDLFLLREITISKSTTFSELRKLFPTHRIWEVETGFNWIYFDDILFEYKKFYLYICFEGEMIRMIGFSMQDNTTSTWENWSEENELQKEKYYKQWITFHIGERRKFSWGIIDAYFDRKAGDTSIWINYN
jgi:hypothetical protein